MTREEFEKRIVEIAQSWIGIPFLHHGRSRSQGVDCLGLLSCIFQEIGLDITAGYNPYQYRADWFVHTRQEIYLGPLMERGIVIPKEAARAGDIHYFKPGVLLRAKIDRVSHAGMDMGNWVGGGNFIHALRERPGVRVSNLNSRAWALTYAGTVRLKIVTDLLGE